MKTDTMQIPGIHCMTAFNSMLKFAKLIEEFYAKEE